ncbi:signal recognition particle-docking protein FtsY [Calothrix sp. NIES-3974]|uniref:signal recognition particle-docking protein FtsY n=1 Tax=Calothrix sp. NIES-3974 TaxID=2005462 RepID=UPI000B5FDE11|nr:signal recognition particle-docking protein FtsY [Calothrix sp. NIES-3974]BAZ04369.1 signal recognition particle-docking protein FtsY [Calothrix sp. NIES-3974]
MVFNWFRRQHDDPTLQTQTPDKQETDTSVSEPAETSESNESSANSAPDVASDMLAFAKAAYKNIQQKQAVTNPETSTDTASEVGEVKADGDDLRKEVVEVEQPPEVTGTTTGADIASETVREDVSVDGVIDGEKVDLDKDSSLDTENLGTPENTSTTLNTDVAEPATKPTPSFLERAAAEREAKQERLMATAISDESPIASPSENAIATPGAAQDQDSASTAESEELSFDEGFIWSAEVLAAQGRKAEDISLDEITWLKKLRQGLDKTRRSVVNQLKAIVGQGPLNQAAVGEIEALLLQADVGIDATEYIIETLQNRLREEALPPDAAIAYLKEILRGMLDAPLQKSAKPVFAPDKDCLNIWLMTGVNGAGKTTTIGKLAHLAQKSGYRCLIGAADTFRAAAVEQVKVWGSRSGVEVIANPGKNTDPAAVVFDAIAAAQSRQTELLLVDTAGRLQNKKNLMEELSKIRRIIDKKAPDAKIESLLVLDATLGQNGLRQAEVFSQAAQLSGVVLTKLDSTAKGGVALAVVKQLGLPIRFIGAGEGIEDLRPFSSYEFVEALLNG